MTYDASKLVSVYIKIRDARDKLTEQYEKDKAKLDAQMDTIELELLNICKANGQDGGKTAAGTFTRSVKNRYWSSDWAAMSRFILEHDAVDLLEQRIHQTNMKNFLAAHPNLIPEGLNVDSKYIVTVRRARS